MSDPLLDQIDKPSEELSRFVKTMRGILSVSKEDVKTAEEQEAREKLTGKAKGKQKKNAA